VPRRHDASDAYHPISTWAHHPGRPGSGTRGACRVGTRYLKLRYIEVVVSLPIEDLTPKEIVDALDAYIVGQSAAKRAVAVALRNRYRRQQLPAAERDDILPKNILMIGPTGVGKTEIARRLAQLARAPFVKIEATKFTEVGYVGRDVESMIRDLVGVAVRLVEKEKVEQIRPEVERRVFQQLLDLLQAGGAPPRRRPRMDLDNPILRQTFEIFGKKLDDGYPDDTVEETPEDTKNRARRRKRLERRLAAGELDEDIVEIETEEAHNPFVQVFSPQGMEEMGLDVNQIGSPFPPRRTRRKVTVAEAREVLFAEEARKLVDRAGINSEAVYRTEQSGIIFLDELDKVAEGPDRTCPARACRGTCCPSSKVQP
jgi:ATP-dependent HslUV protease ATP-binding subunit HslU